MRNDSGRWLSASAAAHRLGITTDTLLRWVADGRVEAVLLTNGMFRFAAEEIARVRAALGANTDSAPQSCHDTP